MGGGDGDDLSDSPNSLNFSSIQGKLNYDDQ